jgi:hypothetical protein
MQVDLEELEALERKASEKPWEADGDWVFGFDDQAISTEDDAAFIAKLRNAAPSLIAELREARKRIAEAHADIVSAAIEADKINAGRGRQAKYSEGFRDGLMRAARLLQPAKDTV